MYIIINLTNILRNIIKLRNQENDENDETFKIHRFDS